jgi:hypothetical protein
MKTEHFWEDILKTALLGTERQPLVTPVADAEQPIDGVLALLGGLDTADAEGALLAAAAVLSLYRCAGQLPATHSGAAPEPCPPDTTPCCSRAAGARLELILHGQNRALLPEWLEAAGAAGLRVPEEHLPALLASGRRQATLRGAIMAVLGQRGRWLAAYNPEWSYVAGEPAESDEATWQTGTAATRVALLRRLRSEDPQSARELLLTTWDTESPKDRSEFIGTFFVGLGPDDEPFLEQALDDKRKETRDLAARLLASLPTSGLVRRVTERVSPLLSLASPRGVQKLKLRGDRLEVTLPESYDAALQRDGIEEKPPAHMQLGEKAWWLQQTIGIVPPRFWCETWQRTPSAILSAARRGAWEQLLLFGFRTAALRHHDTEWILALLAEVATTPTLNAGELLQHLPRPQREEFVLNAFTANSSSLMSNDSMSSVTLLQTCQHPWSEALARAFIDGLRLAVADTQNSPPYWLLSSLKDFARFIPPSMIDELADGWPVDSPNWDYWRNTIDNAIALLQFRHDMLQELRTS